MEINKVDILMMEGVILSSLCFQLIQPTILTFLEGFIEMDEVESMRRTSPFTWPKPLS